MRSSGTALRSFCDATANEPEAIELVPFETAVLVIDIQKTNVAPKDDPLEARRWPPFFERVETTVIPNTRALRGWVRSKDVEAIHAPIACQTQDGRDRSLSPKKPGFSDLLLAKDREDSQIVPAVGPEGDEIVVAETTDLCSPAPTCGSFSTHGDQEVIVAGIVTDRCISSSVRRLADERFKLDVVEDRCATATGDLPRPELEIIDMIHCRVLCSAGVRFFLIDATTRRGCSFARSAGAGKLGSGQCQQTGSGK